VYTILKAKRFEGSGIPAKKRRRAFDKGSSGIRFHFVPLNFKMPGSLNRVQDDDLDG